MKTTILIICMTIFSTFSYCQEHSTEALYLGYVDSKYVFEDSFGEIIECHAIKPSIYKKFDLRGEDFVGETFKLTYQITPELDEEMNEFDFLTIVNLIEVEGLIEEESEEDDEE